MDAAIGAAAEYPEKIMKVSAFSMNYQGKKITVWRVLDERGQVCGVFDTEADALASI